MVVTMDTKLLVTIACEAILGCERTNVPGQEAAKLFEDIKAEMDDQSKDPVPDYSTESNNSQF